MPVTEINGQKWSFSLDEYLELTQKRTPPEAAAGAAHLPTAETPTPESTKPPVDGAMTAEILSSQDRQLVRAIEAGPKVARLVASAMGNVPTGVFMGVLMGELNKSRPELSRAFTELEKLAQGSGLPGDELVIRKQDGRQIRFSPGPTLRRIYPTLMKRLSR